MKTETVKEKIASRNTQKTPVGAALRRWRQPILGIIPKNSIPTKHFIKSTDTQE